MSEKEGDDEWEEEETTVVVQLTGILETDFAKNVKGECSILGIDTDKPLLQLDQYTFVGDYEDSLGTCLLFEEKKNAEGGKENTKKELKYFCKTEKKLNMIRAFVSPKISENQDSVRSEVADTDEHVASSSAQSDKLNEKSEAVTQNDELHKESEPSSQVYEDIKE